MNKFFLYYIDMFAVLTSILVAIVLTLITIRKSETPLRRVAPFFMFFGPSAILVHMSCHILEINYRAIGNIKAGKFIYDFRFYSLMLMAVVLIYCNQLLLKRIKKFIEGNSSSEVLKAIGMIVLVSLPTVPFTPIGSLPTMACIITLIALPFVKKQKATFAAFA